MRNLKYLLWSILGANTLFLAVVAFQAISEGFDISFVKQWIAIEEIESDPFRNFVPFEDEGEGLLASVESSYRVWNESEDSSRVLHLVKKMSRHQDEIAKTAEVTSEKDREPTKLKN